MTDYSVNVLKAIILYLDETGFDFDKNSAKDLLNSISEISKLANDDVEVKDRIIYYVQALEGEIDD